MERGARLSGSRFAYLRGELVMLELALVHWAMRSSRPRLRAGDPAGAGPRAGPVRHRLLPDTEQQIYHLPDDDLYLVGTCEVALASLHAGEILDAGELPLRYAGFSRASGARPAPPARTRAGSSACTSSTRSRCSRSSSPTGADEHERLLAIEEAIMTALEIPYRVVNIAIDDLGACAAKKYDIEAWLPGQGRYRELTSTSNTTDFQARRLEIRFRRDRAQPEVLHTLNGTAVAVGRTIIALLENGQQDDGSVALPAALAPYGAPAELPPAD